MSSSSPSRPVPTGFPMPSVEDLASHFDNVNLGSSSPSHFVGGFKDSAEHKTALEGTAWKDKPLPIPSSTSNLHSTKDSSVPASLRPGHGHGPASGAHQPTFQVDLFTGPRSRSSTTNLTAPVMPMPTPSIPSQPYSLTMQYAISAPPAVNNYSLMSRNPPANSSEAPSYVRHQHSSSTATPAATPSPIITRTRASSSPPSPTSAKDSISSGSTVQCNGITKAGKRCTRLVKAPPPLSFFVTTSSEPVQRFCFQHVKEIVAQSGYYSRKEGAGWVKFADWIPDYLHADTQAALRVEMEKPVSKADVSGYIYAYEIRDEGESNELRIKVGRTVKLVKRLDEWSKQCTSKEVILRGWWPGKVEDEDEDKANGTSMLRGKVVAGENGPYCHKLERLVHLELADLAVYAPYLDPEFPKTTGKAKDTKEGGTSSTPSTPGRSPKPAKLRMPGGLPCKDCGAVHKEIFTFRRATTRKYKDKEWEQLVNPVITRWGTFVEQCV